MHPNPLVSVCVVTYNQEAYIEDCLKSILQQQTSFDFEVIIGNDCSTDRTGEIISKYAALHSNKVQVVNYDRNVGPFVNFNHVHSLARGKYVAHCDGDDLFLPGKLEKQFNFMEANQDMSVVWHKVNYFTDNGKEVAELSAPHNQTAMGQLVSFGYALRCGTVATHSSMMYRKSARRTYNPKFDTLDLYYTLEYLSVGNGFILNEVLGKYRVNALNSFSVKKKENNGVRNLVITHWNTYLKNYPAYRSQIFIFALVQLLIDLKNKRSTWRGFLALMWQSKGSFSLAELIETFKSTKYLRLPDSIRYE
jgi:glycosyltransferase involved in cell wall biosynthesis